jgi:DNA modification methylase
MQGDALVKLAELESQSVDCIFTSPDPPFSAKIGIGSTENLPQYISGLVKIFSNSARVLKDKGTLFVQTGDYHDNSGCLRAIPYIFALAMLNDGWILRSDLIWHRPDDSPQEDMNRFKRDCEHIFMFAKTTDHYFNQHNITHGTSLISEPYIEPRQGQFLSGFPYMVIMRCLEAGCPEGGTVLDPFAGSGITGVVALKERRNFIGIELEEFKIPKILKELKKVK